MTSIVDSPDIGRHLATLRGTASSGTMFASFALTHQGSFRLPSREELWGDHTPTPMADKCAKCGEPVEAMLDNVAGRCAYVTAKLHEIDPRTHNCLACGASCEAMAEGKFAHQFFCEPRKPGDLSPALAAWIDAEGWDAAFRRPPGLSVATDPERDVALNWFLGMKLNPDAYTQDGRTFTPKDACPHCPARVSANVMVEHLIRYHEAGPDGFIRGLCGACGSKQAIRPGVASVPCVICELGTVAPAQQRVRESLNAVMEGIASRPKLLGET